MTPPTLPAAVLWDMDGTLVNTEPYWIASEIELAERDGGHWTHEDGLTLVGNDLRYSAAQLRARAGIRGSDEEIIDDLLRLVIAKARTEGAPWRPGALDLLTALRTAGNPCARVTMSSRAMADVSLEHLPGGTVSADRRGTARTSAGLRGHRGFPRRYRVGRGRRRAHPRSGVLPTHRGRARTQPRPQP